MTWDRIYIRIVGLAIAIAMIVFGNRTFGLALLAVMVVAIFVGPRIRRDPTAHVLGLHPQLFAAALFFAGGVLLVFAAVHTYIRDEELPAPLFWPIFYGLGAVLCLTIATASFRYWRSRR
jgi:hypothetical protein